MDNIEDGYSSYIHKIMIYTDLIFEVTNIRKNIQNNS